MNFRTKTRCKGFTLAELLMAIWVMSIILAAVATLAFALGSANDSADDNAEIQSRVRFTTMKVSELIKNCKLICLSSSSKIAIWKDDINSDGYVNPDEIIYIDTGSDNDKIRIIEFTASGAAESAQLSLAAIGNGSAHTWLNGNAAQSFTDLITNCSYVTFSVDAAAPYTKCVGLMFGIANNGSVENYQINTSLRCWAGHLLNSSGETVGLDDDI